MCGICGYIAMTKGAGKLAKEYIDNLLIEASTRGTDAAGIAFANPSGKMCGIKNPGTASELVKSASYKKLLAHNTPDIVIGHARAKTQGDANNNNNNHPLFTPSGLGLVHNGMISNDNTLFTKYSLPRIGEVDSEIIIRLIDHYHRTEKNSTVNAIKKAAGELAGSMACAMIDSTVPDKLYLWRSGNPLHLALDTQTNVIYFLSTDVLLKNAIEKHSYIYGLFEVESNNGRYIYMEVPNNTGMVLHIGQKAATITETFTIERPAVSYYGNGYGYQAGAFGDTEYWRRQHQPKKKGKKKDDTGDTGASRTYQHNPEHAIFKPSVYTNPELEARERVLQNLEKNGTITDTQKQELQRITNCLNDRMIRRIEDIADREIDNEQETMFETDSGIIVSREPHILLPGNSTTTEGRIIH